MSVLNKLYFKITEYIPSIRSFLIFSKYIFSNRNQNDEVELNTNAIGDNAHIDIKKKTIVFVTYEIAPFIPGGAGVFLGAVIKEINNDFNVIVLAMFGRELEEKIRGKYYNLNLYFADDLISKDERSFIRQNYSKNKYIKDSYRAYVALSKLCNLFPIDFIEFFEYTGISFFTLYNKRLENEFNNIKIIERFQGSMGLIYKNEGYIPLDIVTHRMLLMEETSIPFADIYFSPSESIWNEYQNIYKIPIEAKKIISAPQTIYKVDRVWREDVNNKYILFFGKLQPIKGIDVLIEAFKNISNIFPDVKLVVAGPDTKTSRAGQSYKQTIQKQIGNKLMGRIIFVDMINHQTMQDWIKKSIFAVVPSKWEAYCLALHELKATGIPLIINRINGFIDFFNENIDCIYYDGSVKGLTRALKQMISDNNLKIKLSTRYKTYTNYPVKLVDAYKSLLDIQVSNNNLETKKLKNVYKIINNKNPTLQESMSILGCILRDFFIEISQLPSKLVRGY